MYVLVLAHRGQLDVASIHLSVLFSDKRFKKNRRGLGFWGSMSDNFWWKYCNVSDIWHKILSFEAQKIQETTAGTPSSKAEHSPSVMQHFSSYIFTTSSCLHSTVAEVSIYNFVSTCGGGGGGEAHCHNAYKIKFGDTKHYQIPNSKSYLIFHPIKGLQIFC